MDMMSILINVAILGVFLFLLDRSSYAVITGAADISKMTRIGYTSVGFIFVALSTSLPEAVVSLFAALEGEVGLAVGNVLGSNIANVCLVVGFPVVYGCFSKRISKECLAAVSRKDLSSLFFGLFISSILPLILVRGTLYGPFVGLVLVSLFVVYSYHLSRSSVVTGFPNNMENGAGKVLMKAVTWTAAGIVGVILSGYALVYSVSNLATIFGLSGTFIGGTIVAVGTSLPELAVSLKSIQKNHIDFALSNAVGSCFANLTIILGMVFVFSKVSVRVDAYFDLVFFSLISNLFLWFFLSRGRLGLKEGLALLLIYAIFLADFARIFRLI